MDGNDATETLFFGSSNGNNLRGSTSQSPTVTSCTNSLPPPMGRFRSLEEPLKPAPVVEYPTQQTICMDISLTNNQSFSAFRSQPYFVPVQPMYVSAPKVRSEEKSQEGIKNVHIHVMR